MFGGEHTWLDVALVSCSPVQSAQVDAWNAPSLLQVAGRNRRQARYLGLWRMQTFFAPSWCRRRKIWGHGAARRAPMEQSSHECPSRYPTMPYHEYRRKLCYKPNFGGRVGLDPSETRIWRRPRSRERRYSQASGTHRYHFGHGVSERGSRLQPEKMETT